MPNPKDPFPDIDLSPGLGEETGPLLAVSSPDKLSLHRADKLTLYMNIVKALNKKGLSGRPPTVWRTGQGGTGPARSGVFYTSPSSKNGQPTSSGGYYMVPSLQIRLSQF